MIAYLLILLVLILLACTAVAGSAARKARERAGLPKGRVLYSDTGVERRPRATLVSWEHGLKGRPDYIVEMRAGIVPVEIKSSVLPPSGRPYDSHVMQLACYCLLCEAAMKAHVPFGVIRYRNGEVRVKYTQKLRAHLLSLLAEMRNARALLVVHRQHSQARRCAGCGFRDKCDESLCP